MVSENDDKYQQRLERHGWSQLLATSLATSILVVLVARLSPRWPGPWVYPQIILFVCGPFVIVGVIAGIGITIALRRWKLHPRKSASVMVVCSAVLLADLWRLAVHLDILPGNESRFYSYPQFWLAIAIGLSASLAIAFRWRVPSR